MRCSGLVACALLLASCGASTTEPSAPKSQAAVVPSVPAATHAVASRPAAAPASIPASWSAITADEKVWRRADLDSACPADTAGHFLPVVAGGSIEHQPTVEELGCSRLPQAEIRYTQSDGSKRLAYGQPYCCPRSLTGAPPPHSAGAKSCEQAVLEVTRQAAPEVPDEQRPTNGQYGAVLNRGSYFKHCAVPDDMGIDICIVVERGRPLGITVRTSPTAPKQAECIAAGALGLVFPDSPRADVTRTVF
jgi:hypothetical protein